VQELLNASQQAEQHGDIDKAVSLMNQLCALVPKSGSAHNRTAVLLATKKKRFREAYDHAVLAVELEPGNLTFQSNMLKILAKVEDSGEGVKVGAAKPQRRPFR
jgi:Flp pilus assembly protein TadD